MHFNAQGTACVLRPVIVLCKMFAEYFLRMPLLWDAHKNSWIYVDGMYQKV